MNALRPNIPDLLHEALALPEGERPAFIAAACQEDEQLKNRLRRLVEASAKASRILESPVAEGLPTVDQPSSVVIGTQIGPYKLLEQIGEGGMGVVYMAQQTRPVKRKVALKIIKPGMDSKAVVARFEAERQALALMDHANIARVFDGGTTEAGRPYFVMELVCGIPITEFCDSERLTTEQRLRLFIDVCRAVQHAHQKAIIHRDLKPSNVLVTLHDGGPAVKVIDFGVAKALNQELTERTLFTQFSQMIGTPLYMSPEQAEMHQFGVDTRSDVYSLGVLLYELITGTTPFDKERLKSAGLDEMRRIIQEEEPETVSTRLARTRTLRSAGHAQAATLPSAIRHPQLRELDWIVAKTLEKDRNRRYESASALADDVHRFLANEPITARPTSQFYRLRKYVRRHPAKAILALASIVAAAVMAMAAWYHNQQLARANSNLDAANRHLHESNRKLSATLADARRLESEAIERESLVRLQAYARDMRFALGAWAFEQPAETLEHLQRHVPEQGQADLRGFEWHWLHSHFPSDGNAALARPLARHSADVMMVDLSPDERWVASVDRGGLLKICELKTGREIKAIRYSDAEITSVRFSPDGQTLATAGVDRTVRLWAVADWSEIGVLRGHERTVASIAWSPDSQWIATAGRDHRLKIWNAQKLAEFRTLPDFRDVVCRVAWSPTGDCLVAVIREAGLYRIDTQTWQASPFQDNRYGTLAVLFSGDGRYVVTGGYSDRIYCHEVKTGRFCGDVLVPHKIDSLAFSPDQRQLFSGHSSGLLAVSTFDPDSGTLTNSRAYQLGKGVMSVAIVSAGGQLVTADQESGLVQTWPVSPFAPSRQDRNFASRLLAISSDRDVACTVDSRGMPQLQSFPDSKTLGPLQASAAGQIQRAMFFPGGDKLLILDGNTHRLFDVNTRRHLGDLEVSGSDALPYLAISPRGRFIAGSVLDKAERKLAVWDTATRRRVRYLPYPVHDSLVLRLAFAPDETTLALASPSRDSGCVVLWNVADGITLDTIDEQAIADLEFSSDGQVLALARGWEVLIWSKVQRRLVNVLRGHSAVISDLSFSAHGRTIASVDKEGIIRLWHVPTRQGIGVLSRLGIPCSHLLFRSPYQLVNYPNTDLEAPTTPTSFLVFDASQPDVASHGNEDHFWGGMPLQAGPNVK